MQGLLRVFTIEKTSVAYIKMYKYFKCTEKDKHSWKKLFAFDITL